MNYLKAFEKFNQDQIEIIEDLFTMYFVDGWGAVDTLKVPKETGQDYEDYLKIPILYRLSIDEHNNFFRCSIFISPKLVDMDKFLSDVNKFIERVRVSLKSDTFSCRAGFQESYKERFKNVIFKSALTSGTLKKVYRITIIV